MAPSCPYLTCLIVRQMCKHACKDKVHCKHACCKANVVLVGGDSLVVSDDDSELETSLNEGDNAVADAADKEADEKADKLDKPTAADKAFIAPEGDEKDVYDPFASVYCEDCGEGHPECPQRACIVCGTMVCIHCYHECNNMCYVCYEACLEAVHVEPPKPSLSPLGQQQTITSFFSPVSSLK